MPEPPGRPAHVPLPVLRDWLLFLLLAAGFLWLVLRGAGSLGYNWQWYQVPRALFAVDGDLLTPGPLLQ
ncbi:MAG: amino acid ABC transporter permease, partial [Humidesulfovibrio sp.]|nr:amino acid ABC transporter permease [Humidesulfovibrio sp.]